MGGGAFEGTRHLDYSHSRLAIELPKEINAVRGDTRVVLTRPAGMTWLVLWPEIWSKWRLKPGDYVTRTVDLHDATGHADGECVFRADAAHGFTTGDGPYKFTEDGTLPAEIDDTTLYWVIVKTTTVFQVALSQAAALAGTYVEFTDDGVPDNRFAVLPVAPTVSVADGYGSLLLDGGHFTFPPGQPTEGMFVMSAPAKLTVGGLDAASILTYWWLP